MHLHDPVQCATRLKNGLRGPVRRRLQEEVHQTRRHLTGLLRRRCLRGGLLQVGWRLHLGIIRRLIRQAECREQFGRAEAVGAPQRCGLRDDAPPSDVSHLSRRQGG